MAHHTSLEQLRTEALTLTTIAALSRVCDHPTENRVAFMGATAEDPSYVPACWCGACGAVAFEDATNVDGWRWNRPALNRMLSREELEHMQHLVYGLRELTRGVRRLVDEPADERAACLALLTACVDELAALADAQHVERLGPALERISQPPSGFGW